MKSKETQTERRVFDVRYETMKVLMDLLLFTNRYQVIVQILILFLVFTLIVLYLAHIYSIAPSPHQDFSECVSNSKHDHKTRNVEDGMTKQT